MRIYDSKEISLEEILRRETTEETGVASKAAAILEDVKKRGDQALFDYSEKFDGVKLSTLFVSEEEIEKAVSGIPMDFMETLMQAKENIEDFHKRQKRNSFINSEKDGVILGQRILPLERVGLYVPGGTASYPSSVLMNAIPAKIAGVEELIMATPPGRDGNVPALILTAAALCGVTKILKVGGAQAIAALAYGTESVPRVDKIVGPGNAYVAAAKRLVSGTVAIDMIAGPSEILVLADDTCNPAFVAADLLSQAEHDPLSSAVLITDSRDFAEKVQKEVTLQLLKLPRREIAEKSLANRGKIILTADLREGIRIANAIAPEHLELCTDDPFSLLPLIRNAGSVFLGKYAPEALGDYFAGPNHVLPTNGTARFSSPLSTDDFIKKSSFSYYTKEALEKVEKPVADFARREGLDAHARSIEIRFEKSDSEK